MVTKKILSKVKSFTSNVKKRDVIIAVVFLLEFILVLSKILAVAL